VCKVDGKEKSKSKEAIYGNVSSQLLFSDAESTSASLDISAVLCGQSLLDLLIPSQDGNLPFQTAGVI